MTQPVKVLEPAPQATPANPFKALLYSRKFWLAAVGVAQTVAGHYLTLPLDVTMSINGLLAVVIAAIAWEDGPTK